MTDVLWDGLCVAQSSLDGQASYSIFPPQYPAVFKFDADDNATIPCRFMTGERSLGDPFMMKYIRGIAAYGIGHIQVRVFIDKAPVALNRPIGHPEFGKKVTYGNIEMVETPDPQRILWLPRGTMGRTINIEGSGTFKHIRGIVVFFDPLIGEEDG